MTVAKHENTIKNSMLRNTVETKQTELMLLLTSTTQHLTVLQLIYTNMRTTLFIVLTTGIGAT